MTSNKYLADRDAESLKPLFEALGLTTASLSEDREQSRTAYDADVTYGSGDRFAFDYLFEHLEASHDATRRCRPRAFAVIDEADSVMIDEASSPLIVSALPPEPHPIPEPYIIARRVVTKLDPQCDYVLERGTRVQLLPSAIQAIEDSRHIIDYNHLQLQRPWEDYIRQAIVANHFLLPDVHYVVRDGEVLYVEQHTGRIFPERTWRDGLHQAIQGKERIVITNETTSVARITRQRFFNLYEHKCGMTGTARAAADEFRGVYFSYRWNRTLSRTG